MPKTAMAYGRLKAAPFEVILNCPLMCRIIIHIQPNGDCYTVSLAHIVSGITEQNFKGRQSTEPRVKGIHVSLTIGTSRAIMQSVCSPLLLMWGSMWHIRSKVTITETDSGLQAFAYII